VPVALARVVVRARAPVDLAAAMRVLAVAAQVALARVPLVLGRGMVVWGMALADRATATVMAPAMVMAAAKEERAGASTDLDLANDI
jgi:hypothetical protein